MADPVADSTQPPPTEFREPEPFDSSSFPCPRCGTTMSAADYRPCDSCIAELKATQRGQQGQVPVVEAFEPKMNVTPNAVALKDD